MNTRPIKPFDPDEAIKDWTVPMNAEKLGGQLGPKGAIAGGLQSLAFVVANQNQAKKRAIRDEGINEATANIYAALPALLGRIADGTDYSGILKSIRENMQYVPEKSRNEINKTITTAMDTARKDREKTATASRNRMALETAQSIIGALQGMTPGENVNTTIKPLLEQWTKNSPDLTHADFKSEYPKLLKEVNRLNAKDIAKDSAAELELKKKEYAKVYEKIDGALSRGEDISDADQDAFLKAAENVSAQFYINALDKITAWENLRLTPENKELSPEELLEKRDGVSLIQTDLEKGKITATEENRKKYKDLIRGLPPGEQTAALNWWRDFKVGEYEAGKKQAAEEAEQVERNAINDINLIFFNMETATTPEQRTKLIYNYVAARKNLSTSRLSEYNKRFNAIRKQWGIDNTAVTAAEQKLKTYLKAAEDAYRPLQDALTLGADIDPKLVKNFETTLYALPPFNSEKKRLYGILSAWRIKRATPSADAGLTDQQKSEKIKELEDIKRKLQTGELEPTDETWTKFEKAYAGLPLSNIDSAEKWRTDFVVNLYESNQDTPPVKDTQAIEAQIKEVNVFAEQHFAAGTAFTEEQSTKYLNAYADATPEQQRLALKRYFEHAEKMNPPADTGLTEQEKKDTLKLLSDILADGVTTPITDWTEYNNLLFKLSGSDFTNYLRNQRTYIEKQAAKADEDAKPPEPVKKTGGEIYLDIRQATAEHLRLRASGSELETQAKADEVDSMLRALESGSAADRLYKEWQTAIEQQDADIQNLTIKNQLNAFNSTVEDTAADNAGLENRWELVNEKIEIATDGLPDDTAEQIRQKLTKTATNVFDTFDKKQQAAAVKKTKETAAENITSLKSGIINAAARGQDYSEDLLELSKQTSEYDRIYNDGVPSTFTKNIIKETTEASIDIMLSNALNNGGLDGLFQMKDKLMAMPVNVEWVRYIQKQTDGLLESRNAITTAEERQADERYNMSHPDGIIGAAQAVFDRLGDGNLSTEAEAQQVRIDNWSNMSDEDKKLSNIYMKNNGWNTTRKIATVAAGVEQIATEFGAVYSPNNLDPVIYMETDQNKKKVFFMALAVYKNAVWNMSPDQRQNPLTTSFVAEKIADHMLTFSTLLNNLGFSIDNLLADDGKEFKDTLNTAMDGKTDNKNALLYKNVLDNADMVNDWIKNVKEGLKYGKK